MTGASRRGTRQTLRHLVSGALILAGAPMLQGCSRPALLAGGPVRLTESPAVLRFEKPVPIDGPSWEICFEFELPRDSFHAGGISAVLLSASGRRHPLVDATLDRRGDRIVCQVGKVDAFEPGSPAGQEPGASFEAVELTAGERLQLRELRGGSVP